MIDKDPRVASRGRMSSAEHLTAVGWLRITMDTSRPPEERYSFEQVHRLDIAPR